jgi:tetratricopeptide (TPR) repeat protein
MNVENIVRFIENPRVMNEQTAEELKLMTENYPWFSLGWVLYTKNLKQIQSPEYDSVLKETAIRVNNRKLLYQFINSEITFETQSFKLDSSFSILESFGNETNQKGDSLIDKFLASNPGVIRRNSAVEDERLPAENKDFIEKSTAENDDLITETLANIYFQQKNFEKAIHAYQKLSLKYPEKSIYFATRIKEIEDLKNTN